MTNENSLDQKVNIPKFPLNETKFYSLNQSQEWVKELLMELNEKAEEHSPEDYLNHSNLDIELSVTKKFTQEMGEYLLIKGSLKTNYLTQCVRTLVDMQDAFEIEFKASFINDLKAKEEQYEDETEVFLDNDMYDLYFHHKNFADVKEMIHEVIFLNINQYPVADSESELAWANGSSDTKQ